MRLIQRKCPNCGANLSFDSQAKEVTCEYCKQTLTIEREANNDNFDTTDFSLHVAKYYEQKQKNYTKIIAGIVIVVILFSFVVLCINVFHQSIKEKENKSNQNSNREEDIKKQYTIDILDLDDKSLELFHKETKKQLDKNKSFLPGDSTETEWTLVGMYLLVAKDMNKAPDRRNILFDVYQKTYTVNNQKISAYSGVKYSNLKLSSDGIILHTFTGNNLSIMNFIGGASYFIYGHEGIEDFYAKEIRQYIEDYTITATDGLYLENK